jgi:hypothetical protein
MNMRLTKFTNHREGRRVQNDTDKQRDDREIKVAG